MLNLGLKSEYVISFFGLGITNTFLTSLVVTVLLSGLAMLAYFSPQGRGGIFVRGMRVIVAESLKLIDMVTQDRRISKKVLPLILTFFIFIVTANLLALVPGFLGALYVTTSSGRLSLFRSPNSDLTTTLALALISVVSVQYFSIDFLGLKGFILRFINFRSPTDFILGMLEMISETVRIISFSFRLFGNVFAGEVLLLIAAFFLPYVLPLPFMVLELFVGTIQAFIFSILTLAFVKTATVPGKDIETATVKKNLTSELIPNTQPNI